MNAYELTSPQKKLVMWYKCTELFSKGFTKAQISRELGINRKTVRRYLRMSFEEFTGSYTYYRQYIKKLSPYEEKVRMWLDAHNDLSSSQIHDWLRENYSTLPTVDVKTVYNFVRYVRTKYGIDKHELKSVRQYERAEETPYGEYAQADFGESWMRYKDGRRVKIYFFAMVLNRSRRKYIYISQTPFTSEMAVYAHEKAFEFYGGKPRKIIYDQDTVFIKDENLGDYLLTKTFNAFVNQEHFECIFCRKSDPESKGKIENVVKYVKYNFLRGREYKDITVLNEEAVCWLYRTANGLPHSITRLVPDEDFANEQLHLLPYYGVPMMPQRSAQEHCVSNSNVIRYRSNDYSVPTGTYKGSGTKVWLIEKDEDIEVYDKETGKQIASHPISHEKGKYILDNTHRLIHHVPKTELEKEVMEYCNYDELSLLWMKGLYADKARYYNQNLRVLIKGMVNFEPSTLHRVYAQCIDKGLYNAKDLINLCDRTGKRIVTVNNNKESSGMYDDIINTMPEKTPISSFDQYFQL